jgi:hypothetical protein
MTDEKCQLSSNERLIRRLRQTRADGPLINPDGDEAALTILNLERQVERLLAALARAHGVIRKCVTAGVLRADLNQFLADEADYAGAPDETYAIRCDGCGYAELVSARGNRGAEYTLPPDGGWSLIRGHKLCQECSAAKASVVQREWHFDRYRNGRLMAQGVKVVRAATEEEAREIARALLYLDGNLPSDELRLSRNGEGSY